MRILALDLSTDSGWALGDAESPPRLGTYRCSKLFAEDQLGDRWVQFERWLGDMLLVLKPDLVGFEAPIIVGGGKGTTRPTNVETVRFLLGLATIAELVPTRMSIACEDAHIQQVRKHFCGHGFAKKDDVRAMCFRRGVMVADHNQADAVAILSFLQHCHGCPAPWARELPKQGGGLLIVPGTTQLRKAGAR